MFDRRQEHAVLQLEIQSRLSSGVHCFIAVCILFYELSLHT